MTTKKAAILLMQACASRGIKLSISNRAVTTDSIYLKFEDERLRSCTVRTHPTKKKYRYKWNLFRGYEGECEVIDRGVVRFFFPFRKINEMADAIKAFQEELDSKEVGDDLYIQAEEQV